MKPATGLLLLVLLLMITRARAATVRSNQPPPQGDRTAFIAWLIPHAQDMQRRLGIPASAAIAQAMLESASGSSFLAQNARNLFGMTATGTGAGNPFWHGEKVFRGDRNWRVYDTWHDSVMDYGHLFYRVSAYHRALVHLDDPPAFLESIVPIYAPGSDGNHGYLASVLQLMNTYDLRRYDLPRAQWALDPELTAGVAYI